ncbi:catalase [Sphingomonas sp. H160509]|uniref:catalase n=1 Tax=Sphingomonas sp. H160509 TaxID=2955313 RepID=UPI0020982591|nr:catalase [Sphingomonas sp. H160509]MDD1453296.1 catalase [Sphingomonas sp. H160509]
MRSEFQVCRFRACRKFVAVALLLGVASGPLRAQSTLSAGVHPVSSTDGKSVGDPEQLSERTPGHLIQDLHAAFGAHGARAVHSKGTILLGSFQPTVEARALSHAFLFREAVPVIVRFSNFTGLPTIPDTAGDASPRGFAIKFLLPDGSNYDVVNHSFNGFPVSTASEFGELLEAIGASGKDAAKPTALDRFPRDHTRWRSAS